MIQLPDTVCSPQDVTALLIELREYTAWIEHEAIKKRTGTTSQATPPILSIAATSYLRTIAPKAATLKQLEANIEELEQYKKTAPTISFTLAAAAPETVKKTLTTWCRQQLAPDILVSFDFNRALLGGMVVRYGSHVHDWSFRRQLLNNRTRFTEVLARV